MYKCNTYFPRKHEISTKYSSTEAVVAAHMIVDAPYSIVFDQAENRMHMQNAIMLRLLGKG